MLANVSRTVVAVGCYLLWAAQHVYLAVSGNAEGYDRFFTAAYLPVYTCGWETLARPLFPWVVLLVVALEVAAGVTMLARGRTARLGQLAGFVWNLLLAPTPWSYANLILSAAHLWRATRTFERSVWPFPRREGEPGRRAFPGRSVSHG